MKKTSVIFLLAFLLNLVWENLHSLLYDNYMGGEITEFILIRASLFDAILITLILLPFLHSSLMKNRSWLIVVIATIVAILNEWYGLGTGRWSYNLWMPILPIINIGLTPAIQLGLLGWVTYKLQDYISSRYPILFSENHNA